MDDQFYICSYSATTRMKPSRIRVFKLLRTSNPCTLASSLDGGIYNSWQIFVGPVIHAPLAHLLVPTCKAFLSLFFPLVLPFLDSYRRQF
uniref:Uncharacterized protein n=1 Tax=Populus trichocarpa TaxID=3694 RepID=A0A2K1ZVT2_POPTR